MQSNHVDCQFVLKLCYQSNPHNDGLVPMGSAIRNSFTTADHLTSDELEELFMNRGKALVEKAEQHLLFCEMCQDAAMAAEIELAAWRKALS